MSLAQWTHLTDPLQLESIRERSNTCPQVIFKHSTRCSISTVAWNRVKDFRSPVMAEFYYLDLLQFRPISQEIANHYNVYHESPQLLIVFKGECIYDESHMGITAQEVAAELTQLMA